MPEQLGQGGWMEMGLPPRLAPPLGTGPGDTLSLTQPHQGEGKGLREMPSGAGQQPPMLRKYLE